MADRVLSRYGWMIRLWEFSDFLDNLEKKLVA